MAYYGFRDEETFDLFQVPLGLDAAKKREGVTEAVSQPRMSDKALARVLQAKEGRMIAKSELLDLLRREYAASPFRAELDREKRPTMDPLAAQVLANEAYRNSLARSMKRDRIRQERNA